MASDLKPRRTEREESCFTRAARAIRRALSRICRDQTPSSSPPPSPHQHAERPDSLESLQFGDTDSVSSYIGCSDRYPRKLSFVLSDPDSDHSSVYEGICSSFSSSRWYKAWEQSSPHHPESKVSCNYAPWSETRMLPPPGQKRSSSGPSLGSKKKCRLDLVGVSSAAAPGVSQDNTREVELHATACPSTLQFSSIKDEEEEEDDDDDDDDDDDYDSAVFHVREREREQSPGSLLFGGAPSPPLSDSFFRPPDRKHTDVESSSSVCVPLCSQSAPPGPPGRPSALQDAPVCSAGSSTRGACEFWSVRPDGDPAGRRDAAVEMELPVTAVTRSVTEARAPTPPGVSGRLPRSHSMSSLSRTTSAVVQTLTQAGSVPDLLLQTSCEDFTPEEEDGTYRVRFSCAGLYLCSVTGLVFHMEGEGDVVYTTVPWNRRLLVQHHKKPAGPLFDISCVQRSVCRLHVPHCEVRSTGGCHFLSVAHVKDDGVEFIGPHRITETHVIIDVAGFSAFGNVKDEASPPDPVRALVLLFYRPPADPDPEALLNVLLLPRNVVLQDVRRTRRKIVGDEIYIETSPHCKLRPKQEYTLSTCPEDDSVLIQPTEAEFDEESYDNYFPSFQVNWEKVMRHIKLSLKDADSSASVWERRVCLSSSGGRRSCGPDLLSLPPPEKLSAIRSSFINGISGPVLKSLLDRLFETKVMADAERESVDEIQNQRDKARVVIDTVRKKGEAASAEMIELLCEADPFLCEHLGLI